MSKCEDSLICGFEESKDLESSTKASTKGDGDLSYLSKYGLDESEAKDLFRYVLNNYLRMYEQANFCNIKKASKFANATSNFIQQIFSSKNFRKKFSSIEDENIQDLVSLLSSLTFSQINFLYYLWTISFDRLLIIFECGPNLECIDSQRSSEASEDQRHNHLVRQ